MHTVFKVYLVALAAIETFFTTIFIYLNCSTPYLPLWIVCAITHGVVLITDLYLLTIFCLDDRRQRFNPTLQTHKSLSITETSPLYLGLRVIIYILGSVTSVLDLVVVASFHTLTVLPPRIMESAGAQAAVGIIALIVIVLAYNVLLYDHPSIINACLWACRSKLSKHSSETKADSDRRPLPIKIINVAHNPDPRVFEKPRQDRLSVRTGNESPRPVSTMSTMNPFADPHDFEDVSLN